MRSINGFRARLSTGAIALILLAVAATALQADSGDDSIRRSRAAGIDVAVSLEDLDSLAGGEIDYLEFTVSLDTHFSDLFRFDVAELSRLAIDGSARDGIAFQWRGNSETSHHRNGTLRARVTGDSLSLEQGAEVELRILDVGTGVRTFTWEL